eukprot:scaffold9354_cov17-Tisochrysis_lutea.AAC.3
MELKLAPDVYFFLIGGVFSRPVSFFFPTFFSPFLLIFLTVQASSTACPSQSHFTVAAFSKLCIPCSQQQEDAPVRVPVYAHNVV